MKKTLLTLILLTILAAGYLVYRSIALQGIPPMPANVDSANSTEPALTQSYTNTAYHFALKMPAGYTAQEMPATGGSGETVVLQNQAGDGVQIVITPFDEDPPAGGWQGYTLTKERILQDV